MLLATSSIALQSCSESKQVSAPAPKIDLASECKAYIGELMGRPTSLMKVDYSKEDDLLVGISYNRADDGKLFKYECKIDGQNIVWRGVDLFAPGEGPGRWRDEDAKSLESLQ